MVTNQHGLMKPRVLLLEAIHPEAMAWLRERANVLIPEQLEEDALIPKMRDIEGVVVRVKGRITERLLAHAPALRVVARHGIGLDNVDVEACTRRGVWVVYSPLAATEAVAEHAVALMLAVAKGIAAGDRAVRGGEYASARQAIIGEELQGKTLGIIGFGRIGQRVAQICKMAFAMPILFADVLPQVDGARRLEAESVTLDELLNRSDIVSVHVPLTKENHHLIDSRALARMRSGTMLINTSRGAVVDERALIRVLQEGRLVAGLDVFEEEPLPSTSPLTKLPNVVLTPHEASHTHRALRAMGMVVEDVMRVLRGEAPVFPANKPAAKTTPETKGAYPK